ncbi:hypothetical protein BaRGS_00015625 [Batillaria attramentaria]|uniref:Glutamate [NMDA] receptor subunit 1 n=1 Tax=Batillaria attramentaria TaxID=370345 RepID=A0ABD0L1X5_9CAEN
MCSVKFVPILAALGMLTFAGVMAQPKVVTIGASLSSERHQFHFKTAVTDLNLRQQLAGIVEFNYTSILMDGNPIRSALDVCDRLLPEKVYTVVASHPNSSMHAPISVSYTCGYYHVPVVGVSARDSAFSDVNVHSKFLRTVPPYSDQAEVWVAILQHLNWKNVIFVYSADEEGRKILSQFQTLAEKEDIKIDHTIKYTPGEINYTNSLQEIHAQESRVILLSAGTDDAEVLFHDGEALRLFEEDFAWIVSERAFAAANVPVGVLGLHLVNGTDEEKHIYDAVDAIYAAFVALYKPPSSRITTATAADPLGEPPNQCNDSPEWDISGNKLYTALRTTSTMGRTGMLRFNVKGDRVGAFYEINNINTSKRQVAVGFFGGFQVSSVEPTTIPDDKKAPLRMAPNITWPGGVTTKPKGIRIKRNITVVTLKEIPFVNVEDMPPDGICKPPLEQEDSHSFPCEVKCCSGYCMDMLYNISETCSFNFTVHLSQDGLFGSFERRNNSDQKEWNGMIGELINGEADMIVAPLTINPERAANIDFTKPFKYQGLNILVKKIQKDSSLASFLQPFQDTLWILVGLSVHVVALVLYLLDRFSPFGRFKLAKSEDTEEDALNLSSAMWFSWGVLLNSGIGEGTPRSFSARVLGMVWAGFAMIIVASYTANLAAFLVLDRPEARISGIDDPRLRNPTEFFKYATVKDSAVEMYFKRQVELSTMYRNMEGKNYHNAENAIQAVRDGPPICALRSAYPQGRGLAALPPTAAIPPMTSVVADGSTPLLEGPALPTAASLTTGAWTEARAGTRALPPPATLGTGGAQFVTPAPGLLPRKSPLERTPAQSPGPFPRPLFVAARPVHHGPPLSSLPCLLDGAPCHVGVTRTARDPPWLGQILSHARGLQAFIWDSPRLEHEAANDCDLTTAGDLFGRSGLGIGLKKGSMWTHSVSLAVLELHESGFMEKLDNRWILVDSKSQCPEGNSAPATLGLTNMAGVFMMVAGGIVAGVLLIFIEIAYKRYRGMKEKELEVARNAADRWRGNIEKRKKLRETWQYLQTLREPDSDGAKRRTLRQTLQKQREEQMRAANALQAKKQEANTEGNNMPTPPYRRPSLMEATGSNALGPAHFSPGHGSATRYSPSHGSPTHFSPSPGAVRSGRTVTWHNPAHNPDFSVI